MKERSSRERLLPLFLIAVATVLLFREIIWSIDVFECQVASLFGRVFACRRPQIDVWHSTLMFSCSEVQLSSTKEEVIGLGLAL